MTITLGRITHHNTRPHTPTPATRFAVAMSYLALITRPDGSLTGKHLHAASPALAAQSAREHLEAGETLVAVTQGQVWLPCGQVLTSRCPGASTDEAIGRCVRLEGPRDGHHHPARMYRHLTRVSQ